MPAVQSLGKVLGSAIKSPAVQRALSQSGAYLARMGDEALEEYLQAILDPALRNVMLGENNELKLFSEQAMYNALTGALTAGVMNLPYAMSGTLSGTPEDTAGWTDAGDSDTMEADPVTQAAIDGVNGKHGDGEAYELSSRFFHRQDELLEYTARVEPLEGYQDVACHGSPYSFVNIDADGKEINIPVAEFAKILENSPGFEPGKPIRLLACETGKGEGLPAQYLADYFGVEVMAPDEELIVYPDGKIQIGYDATGTWRVFKPRRK